MSKIVKPDLTYQRASAAGGGTLAYLFHQTSVVANTDTHIAAVKEGSFVWLYVDGVKSSTSINMTAKTIRLNGSTTATHIGKLS